MSHSGRSHIKRELLDWRPIDRAIFNGRRIEAIDLFREAAGCGLREAIEAVFERFTVLERSARQRFSVDTEGYWRGFYS
jgi:hypothetical protein